ncbi:MAG: Exodeoxyribonuclease 7 small subunit [Firmicutes bacterium ADurb.Bin356]|nr:MAG: Exodeoxyribonuclease 7 small subunit [Firmicutes bacterium ADurb.Bin356]
MKQIKSYEEAIAELEEIVLKLENGNISIDEMVKLYEKGVLLGRQCSDLLEAYQGRFDILASTEPKEQV